MFMTIGPEIVNFWSGLLDLAVMYCDNPVYPQLANQSILLLLGSVEEMRSVIQYIDLTQFIDNTPPMHIR